MKRVVLALALLAPSVSFAQVGIGVAVDSDPTIYVPIDLNPSFRLEPFLLWSDDEVGGVSVETRQIGAGGFLRTQPYDRLQPYVGGRLSFMEVEVGPADDDGFRIEPTFGAEFLVTNRVSVAGEAFLYHADLDSGDSSGTGTRLVVRFML